MGWLVKDQLPEKKRLQLIADAQPALYQANILDATDVMPHSTASGVIRLRPPWQSPTEE